MFRTIGCISQIVWPRARGFWINTKLDFSLGSKPRGLIQSQQSTFACLILPWSRDKFGSSVIVGVLLGLAYPVTGVGFHDFMEIGLVWSWSWQIVLLCEFGPRHDQSSGDMGCLYYIKLTILCCVYVPGPGARVEESENLLPCDNLHHESCTYFGTYLSSNTRLCHMRLVLAVRYSWWSLIS